MLTPAYTKVLSLRLGLDLGIDVYKAYSQAYVCPGSSVYRSNRTLAVTWISKPT